MKSTSGNLLAAILALLCAGAAGADNKPGEFALVENGKAMAEIVLPEKADAVSSFAAEELAAFTGKITGTALPIVKIAGKRNAIRFLSASAPEVTNDPALAAAAAKLADDGYVIAVKGNSLRIVSRYRRGYLYGVYELLKKYGGMVWLHPGQEGEICPKKSSFRVPEQLTVRNPAFRLRQFRIHASPGWVPDSYLWLMRNGLQVITWKGQFRKKAQLDFIEKLDPVYMEGGHSLTRSMVGFYPSGKQEKDVREKLFREHPEYFGLRNGKRVPSYNRSGDYSHICTTNPDVLDRIAANLKQRVALYGSQEVIRSFCNDDHNYWCECETCRRLDPPEEAKQKLVSTRWWTFINQMADRLLTPENPNLTLDVSLYMNFRNPPAGCRPDPRVMVTLCPHGRCYIHSLTDEKCPINKRFRNMFEAWHRLNLRAHTFEYSNCGPVPLSYELNEKPWIDDLKFYHSLNMMGFGLVTRVPDGNYKGRKTRYRDENYWFANWQLHYLSGVFSWDVNADFETESERANSLYYGDAWKYMKPYRALLQKAIAKNGGCMGYGVATGFDIGACYDDPELQKETDRLLKEAAKAVSGSPLYAKRVARDRDYLAYEWETAYRSYVLTKNPIPLPKVHREKIRIDGVLDEKVWSVAPEITGFRCAGTPPVKAQIPTVLKVADDGASLYFGILAMKDKSGKVADTASGDGLRSLTGSHFEIFVMPPWYKMRKYYHIGFTHNGKSYQALTTSPTDRDMSIRVDFEFAVKDYPDHWTAEVRFPVRKLGGCLSPRELWRINVARMALRDTGKLEWSSISGGIFHEVPYYRTFRVSPWPGKIPAGQQYPYPEKLKFD